jgi:hypothetical protein
MRTMWICLGLLVGLLAVPQSGSAAAGCCQYLGSCDKTDDEEACTKAGGHHYQLGVCDGKICQPTVADPVTFDFTAVCPLERASSAGFDCVTKDGSFCRGELGPGNHCVSVSDCTAAQLKECLPGFPPCPKQVDPAPAPIPVEIQ